MKEYIQSLKKFQLITGIYLIVVLIGLPLAIHHAYYDIGETKYYFYCGASALLLPALLFKLKDSHSTKNFFKTLSIAEKALLIYWIGAALSTLFSPYRFEAFWGNEGRLCGLFLISIYAIAYFSITRCYKPHPIFIYACILSGIIVLTLGITDFFDLNLLHFKNNVMGPDYYNFTSTIGNINFYSGYGAIIVGLLAGLYTSYSSLKGAIVCYCLMVLSFIGLIVGNSDNAYLTFAVLLAFLPLYLFQNRRGIRRYFMMISGLLFSFMMVKLFSIHFADMVLELNGIPSIIIRWDGFIYVCVGIWIVTCLLYGRDYISKKQTADIGKKMQIIWGIFLIIAAIIVIGILIDANIMGHEDRYGALRNYIVFNNDWGTHRGFAWRKAIENYRNFPLMQKILGNGPDTYGIISYFRNLPESSALYGELFDSVHNEYLQFFVTIGPIATAAYIVFLMASIWDMIKCHCSPYIIGAAFGVFCYCGQAVVSINQIGSTPIMWTLLAMGIAEYRNTIMIKR